MDLDSKIRYCYLVSKMGIYVCHLNVSFADSHISVLAKLQPDQFWAPGLDCLI